ncbi:hypothetical protein BVC71_14165 [Marivivens niveibacter]|uniref:HTH tetR-type domain-containing protein n=1 Tax=Marivivens niveibacter TaxID=1930667 RepID=A0A251WWG6_9RHOB|nr:hypothetical protein BVC71_14165 [Marivivens niveibacter]
MVFECSRKPRQRRKEARPSEIIAAAVELWKERGFAATRLEDIAKGAGIAKGTVYRYFPSKEAVFEAAVEEQIASTTMGRADDLRTANANSEEMLLRYFENVRAELVDSGSFIFLKVLLAEGHRFPDLVRKYEDLVIKNGADVVRGILRRGVDRGELKPQAMNLDPTLVMAPAMMLSLWGTVFDGIQVPDVQHMHHQHVALLLSSLQSEAI